MTIVGLRELRQNASELVREAEAGGEVTITVSGRPAARLVGASSRRWRPGSEVEHLFNGPADPDWTTDRELVDQQIRDPWNAR
ncbi:type II toxin-antitoxin system prevent-host-death family antitoxin [Tsukamurella sp. NPDC003166]|uniref:type II toxin-antitoxin system Phd/YefM family antitoxin n=1 Tax=Tsukamurella sp. NPDC003166 TaxID=3154444 RepID=UPI00339E3053